ncbi:DNA-directed RNA polymerase subunit E [Nanoarchaeota archaeon]
MFYEIQLSDIVRIPPNELKGDIKEMIEKTLVNNYVGSASKDYGIIVTIKSIEEISEGIMIFGDGGVYYRVKFTVISYIPILSEITYGIVSSITDFGAFINIGPIDGLVHISQIMDDEVSISGKEALVGKNSKRVLKVNDIVLARVVTVSYKGVSNVRIALTMKQPGLGKLDWLEQKAKSKK